MWLIVVQSLSFAVLPFTAWIAPNAPDRGYSLSKLTGFFLFSSTCWILTVCGLITESESIIKVVDIAILALGWWGYKKLLPIAELRALLKKYAWSVEAINRGSIAWFIPTSWGVAPGADVRPIHAGCSVLEFIEKIELSGGCVYMPRVVWDSLAHVGRKES
jgi:hypothetical protein